MNTEQASFYATLMSLALIFVSWCIFGYTILFGRKSHNSEQKSSAPKSWVGLALQLAGIGITFIAPRLPFASPMIGEHHTANIVLQIIASVLAVSSVLLVMAAIKELGKQWSLEARVLEGHKLITTGVYNVVRHPIYTAMLGMLLATGFAFSHWVAIILGLIVFLVGTRIRTNLEEGLLRDAFGEEFENWKARVPRLIPFVKM
jgi:protein-S-isoprenylcysteine O-methyltransferase Ste14